METIEDLQKQLIAKDLLIEDLQNQLKVYKEKELKSNMCKEKSRQRPEYIQRQKVYQKQLYNSKKEEFNRMKEIVDSLKLI